MDTLGILYSDYINLTDQFFNSDDGIVAFDWTTTMT